MWSYGGMICGYNDNSFNLDSVGTPIRRQTKQPRMAVLYEPRKVLDTNTGELVLETAV